MTELVMIAGFSFFAILLQFYHSMRSQKLVDRLTDKVLSYASPHAFSTYATTTPTKVEEEVRFREPKPNGKSNGKVLAGFPNEVDLPDNLEMI